MLKKFRRSSDLDIWIMYARYLMSKNELEKAHRLVERSMQSVEKKMREFTLIHSHYLSRVTPHLMIKIVIMLKFALHSFRFPAHYSIRTVGGEMWR